MIETDLGSQVFTWDDEDFYCHIGSYSQTAKLQVGGLMNLPDLMLVVRKYDSSGNEVFADSILPTPKRDLITFKSKKYRVQTVETDNTDTFFTMTLTTVNDGAKV